MWTIYVYDMNHTTYKTYEYECCQIDTFFVKCFDSVPTYTGTTFYPIHRIHKITFNKNSEN